LTHLYSYTDDNWTVTPAPGHPTVAARWAADRSPLESGHAAQFAAVLDALDAQLAPPVTLADTRQTMEFVAALYASAFTGERVHRGQIRPDTAFAVRMSGTGTPWETVTTR
jgi:predicted dehydrogenase